MQVRSNWVSRNHELPLMNDAGFTARLAQPRREGRVRLHRQQTPCFAPASALDGMPGARP